MTEAVSPSGISKDSLPVFLICPLEGKKNMQARPLYFTGRLSLSHAIHAHEAFDVHTGREYRLEIFTCRQGLNLEQYLQTRPLCKCTRYRPQVPCVPTFVSLATVIPGRSVLQVGIIHCRPPLPVPPLDHSVHREAVN